MSDFISSIRISASKIVGIKIIKNLPEISIVSNTLARISMWQEQAKIHIQETKFAQIMIKISRRLRISKFDSEVTTFDQLKYFYYRFRTLTFANYPVIPRKAFHFVHFETQSVKQTHKTNNRNVIAFVNIERTQTG